MALKLNPNIVSRVHAHNGKVDCLEMAHYVYPQRVEGIAKLVDEFIAKFKEARTLAGKLPLAYRLDLITKPMPSDRMGVPKFGGVPDLSQTFSKIEYLRRNPKANANTKPSDQYMYAPPPLSVFLKEKWPTCPNCHDRLTFVGQISVSDWILAIHQATYTTSQSKNEYKRNAPNDRRSVFGHNYSMTSTFFGLGESWLYFWCCPNNHILELCPEAICWVKYVREDKDMEDMFEMSRPIGGEEKKTKPKKKQKCPPWSISQYRKSARKYINHSNDIIVGPMKPEEVVDIKLRFDIDVDSETRWNEDDKIDSLIEEHGDLFGQEGNFQLFGAPHSQQTERRFMCMGEYPQPHRMMPLLQWDHPEHDMAHQMYGCMACRPSESSGKIYCMMDNSCT